MLPSDRWSSSRIFKPLTQSLQSREETRSVVLPNRQRSRKPSWARILNGQFPYRHRRRLACEKERGVRRCQINTGGEISTSCTPVAGQAKERGLHRRLPKGSQAYKRGPGAIPSKARMSFSLSGLPPLPKSLSGLLNIAGSKCTPLQSISSVFDH